MVGECVEGSHSSHEPRSCTQALVAALSGSALVLALNGCAGSAEQAAAGAGGIEAPPAISAADPAAAAHPAAPGPVVGQGTVLQKAGDDVVLCLGPVMDSYPPQCDGLAIWGWDWSEVDGAESAPVVTWGSYAVQGSWDGTLLTVTRPPEMLALYDPMPVVDPFQDPANAGASTDQELVNLREAVRNDEFVEALSSWSENGYLFVHVVYDDGSAQSYFDERYGEDVVQVRSALRDLEG